MTKFVAKFVDSEYKVNLVLVDAETEDEVIKITETVVGKKFGELVRIGKLKPIDDKVYFIDV